VRLFVTGISGFIGGHFAKHAARAGHEIVGLLRPPTNGAGGIPPAGVATRHGDILDPGSLATALEGADCVCHFAAAFKEAHADEQYFYRVNVLGTANLLAAAAEAGAKRFVLCSTAGIYGRRVNGVIDETHAPQPWNAYERSKLSAEEEVRRGAAAHGMEYVILRPTAVYGPGDRRLAKLFRNAARGRFPLFGNGDGRRHMVYVADLAEAFLLACTRPDAANQEMIVAGPEAVPLRELLQTLAILANRTSSGPRLPLKPMLALAALTEDVCRLLNMQPPLHRRRMDFYLNDAAFDCARAREVLAWEPKVSLRDGLAATLNAESLGSTPSALAHGAVWLGEALLLGAILDAAGTRHLLG
jgi:nucleoside-diphosphate-sugar epimerase